MILCLKMCARLWKCVLDTHSYTMRFYKSEGWGSTNFDLWRSNPLPDFNYFQMTLRDDHRQHVDREWRCCLENCRCWAVHRQIHTQTHTQTHTQIHTQTDMTNFMIVAHPIWTTTCINIHYTGSFNFTSILLRLNHSDQCFLLSI